MQKHIPFLYLTHRLTPENTARPNTGLNQKYGSCVFCFILAPNETICLASARNEPLLFSSQLCERFELAL